MTDPPGRTFKPAMLPNKKLLILTEWFAPGYKAGGPIQSCVNMCLMLKNKYDIYVFTTDTDHGEARPYDDVTADRWVKYADTGVHVYYAKRKTLSFKTISMVIDKIDAAFIYLHLFFSPQFVLYPLWLKYREKIKAQIILSPRGTLYDSAISLKWYKKKPLLLLLKWMAIHRKITFHATNKREEEAIGRYFPASKIRIADNLPSTLQHTFKGCAKTAGTLRCIFIARIVPIKNLLFLLELLENFQGHLILTIVGPRENETYWAACEKAISTLPVNVHATYLGPKQNDELPALLWQHHLFVLPTTGESFGHAIFEALLSGRPVMISDQTPWQNLEEKNAGWVLPLNDPGKFTAVLNRLVDCGQQEFDEYAKGAWNYANDFIHDPKLTEQYYDLFN